MKYLVCPIFLLAVLGGCAQQQRPDPVIELLARVLEATARNSVLVDEHFTRAEDGTARHEASGTLAPGSAAGFSLRQIEVLQTDGSDFALQYDDAAAGRVTLTLYVTRVPGVQPGLVFENSKAAIRQIKSVREEIAVPEALASRDERFRQAFFILEDGRLSGLWLMHAGAWSGKVRATLPRDREAEDIARIEELLATMIWPGGDVPAQIARTRCDVHHIAATVY